METSWQLAPQKHKAPAFEPQHQSTETHRAETSILKFLWGPDFPLVLVVARAHCRNWTQPLQIVRTPLKETKLPQLVPAEDMPGYKYVIVKKVWEKTLACLHCSSLYLLYCHFAYIPCQTVNIGKSFLTWHCSQINVYLTIFISKYHIIQR